MALTLAEMETHLNMSADDRSMWTVSSDDPVMQKRLEAVGATLLKESKNGVTKFYTLRADQVLIRKGKRELSDDTKQQLADRLRTMRETASSA